jgi:PPOX class probable F420-dependent enzyme
MSTVLEKATFPDLGREQCIALTTFRKTGQRVVTPVWFAISHGTIYVETHADAGKLKRLRHTARVTLAPCTYSGKVTGSVSEGNARILTESEESTAASAALAKKYGVMRSLYHFVRNARRMLQRKVNVEVVYIAIEPISAH